MKEGIHPEVSGGRGSLRVWKHVQNALDQAGAAPKSAPPAIRFFTGRQKLIDTEPGRAVHQQFGVQTSSSARRRRRRSYSRLLRRQARRRRRRAPRPQRPPSSDSRGASSDAPAPISERAQDAHSHSTQKSADSAGSTRASLRSIARPGARLPRDALGHVEQQRSHRQTTRRRKTAQPVFIMHGERSPASRSRRAGQSSRSRSRRCACCRFVATQTSQQHSASIQRVRAHARSHIGSSREAGQRIRRHSGRSPRRPIPSASRAVAALVTPSSSICAARAVSSASEQVEAVVRARRQADGRRRCARASLARGDPNPGTSPSRSCPRSEVSRLLRRCPSSSPCQSRLAW